MKKLTSVLTAVLLIAAMLTGLGAAAFADDTGNAPGDPIYTGSDDGLSGVLTSANRLKLCRNGKEYLADWDGTVLSGGHDAIYDYYGRLEIVDGEKCGIMDRDGNIIVSVAYGNIEIEGNFAAVSTLEQAGKNDYDAAAVTDGGTDDRKYLKTEIIDLSTGEVRAELAEGEFGHMYLDGCILVISDNDDHCRYFDSDFNELTCDEASELADETNGYTVARDPATGLCGISGVGSSLKIDAEYDEFLCNPDTGLCLSDGYFCARREDRLVFFDAAGEITAQFEVDPDQTVRFYGECAIGPDDGNDGRYIYHADGSFCEINKIYTGTAAGMYEGGAYLIAMHEKSGRCFLLDTYCNVLAEGSGIYVSADGHVVVDDSAAGSYTVYAGTGEPAAEETQQTPSAGMDPVAAAEAQGITIPAEFTAYSGSDSMFTFYSTAYENDVSVKNSPEIGLAAVIGSVSMPFNGRLIGTCGSWDLVEDYSGKYFYIYEPIVDRIAISENTAESDYSAILALAASSGTTAPEGFTIGKGVCGRMINDKGTSVHALGMFHDPSDAGYYNVFYIVNTSDSSTNGNNSRVTVYGYYGNGALVWHEGEFFWVNATYFKAD